MFGLIPGSLATRATRAAIRATVLPPDAEVAGLSQAKSHARRWQWLLSFPKGLSPYLNETGERYHLG